MTSVSAARTPDLNTGQETKASPGFLSPSRRKSRLYINLPRNESEISRVVSPKVTERRRGQELILIEFDRHIFFAAVRTLSVLKNEPLSCHENDMKTVDHGIRWMRQTVYIDLVQLLLEQAAPLPSHFRRRHSGYGTCPADASSPNEWRSPIRFPSSRDHGHAVRLHPDVADVQAAANSLKNLLSA